MRIGFASGDWVHPDNSLSKKEEWGGSGWVRFGQYLDHLPFEIITGTLVWDRDCFRIRTVEDKYVYCDLIFMHRLMHVGLADNVKKGRAAGQIIINDIDDWYWGLDPNNHAFRATDPRFNKQENRYEYRSILANSDLVICSTPYLAQRLREWNFNAPVTVVKNTIDATRFTPHRHVDVEKPIVGWAGSTAHRSGDLETMKGLLDSLYRDGHIELQHSGHVDAPGYNEFASRIGVRDEDVKKLPMKPHQEYPDILTMDIGIVPLRITPFNRAKSDIKGLEYAAAGIPFVAQEIDSYSDLKMSLDVGRVARRPSDWRKHIMALKDYRVREEEAEKNREAIKARDISLGAEAMTEIFNSYR